MLRVRKLCLTQIARKGVFRPVGSGFEMNENDMIQLGNKVRNYVIILYDVIKSFLLRFY